MFQDSMLLKECWFLFKAIKMESLIQEQDSFEWRVHVMASHRGALYLRSIKFNFSTVKIIFLHLNNDSRFSLINDKWCYQPTSAEFLSDGCVSMRLVSTRKIVYFWLHSMILMTKVLKRRNLINSWDFMIFIVWEDLKSIFTLTIDLDVTEKLV